jgi:hypothetical protein
MLATSFTDELTRYQIADPRCQQIIGRWREFAGAEEMWRKIQKHAQAVASHRCLPPLDAKEFIDFVLSAKWSVDRLVEHDKQVKSEFEKLKREIKLAVNDADSSLELSQLLSTFDMRILELHRSSYDFNSPPVSRQNVRGSRDKKAFVGHVGMYLKTHCGNWCEEVVTELVEIVFDKDSNRDQARLPRRPSTRAGRKKRL